jgi:hypothetical protein
MKGAGQFNNLEQVSKTMWDILELAIRKKK